jgi:hypothetical protein
MPNKMSAHEKLVDDFINEVQIAGTASPVLQERIAELLVLKRSVLLANTGRKANTAVSRRDTQIWNAYLSLRDEGCKVVDIINDLATAHSKSPERIKSIVQTFRNITGYG